MKSEYSLSAFVKELREAESVLVCTHASPDADAVGSSCGLQQGLTSLGIASAVHFPEPLPERMLSLVAGVQLVQVAASTDYDALVVLE